MPVVIEMANKPLMALALEKPKIRDYDEVSQRTNTSAIIDWLLNLLGVNDNNKEEHHIETFKFINQSMNHFTYEEIQLAFRNYVSGECYINDKPMLVTQQLNAVVFGNVMKAYSVQKKSSVMNAYRREQKALAEPTTDISQADKDLLVMTGVLNCFDTYETLKEIPNGYGWVYDFFFERGCFPAHTTEFRNEIELRTKAKAESDFKRDQIKGDVFTSLKKFVANLEKGATMKILCKKLILSDLFDSIIENDLDIRTEMRKPKIK